MAQMAARRGWSMDHKNASLGRTARTRIAPLVGADWSIEIVRTNNTRNSKSYATTSFSDLFAGWPGGVAVFGPPIPAKMAAMAEMVLGALDGPMGQKALETLIGPDAASMTGLKFVAKPGGTARNFTMFANVNDVPDAVLDQLEKFVADWIDKHSGEKNHPIVIVGPEGLRVRLRRAIHDPAQMEQFADFSLEARDLLKGPA